MITGFTFLANCSFKVRVRFGVWHVMVTVGVGVRVNYCAYNYIMCPKIMEALFVCVCARARVCVCMCVCREMHCLIYSPSLKFGQRRPPNIKKKKTKLSFLLSP